MFEGLTEEQLVHVCSMQEQDLHLLMEKLTGLVERYKQAQPFPFGQQQGQVHLPPLAAMEAQLLNVQADVIKAQYQEAYALQMIAYYRRCAVNVMEGEVVEGSPGSHRTDRAGEGATG